MYHIIVLAGRSWTPASVNCSRTALCLFPFFSCHSSAPTSFVTSNVSVCSCSQLNIEQNYRQEAQLLLRKSRSYGAVWNSRAACWPWLLQTWKFWRFDWLCALWF